MTIRDNLNEVLSRLPDERLAALLEYAEFLADRSERMEWQAFGREQLCKAYGENEPEYTHADIKSR